MGFQNRKMFLSDQDIPFPSLHYTGGTDPSPPPEVPAALRKMHPRPIFSSDVAYTFLIVFSALFIITFLLLAAREVLLRRRGRQPPPCRRVDPEVWMPLQVCVYGQDATGAAECAVCLEEFRSGDTVKVTPNCGHVFHPWCINTWLLNHMTCPVCRGGWIFGDGGAADDRAAGSTAENEGAG